MGVQGGSGGGLGGWFLNFYSFFTYFKVISGDLSNNFFLLKKEDSPLKLPIHMINDLGFND